MATPQAVYSFEGTINRALASALKFDGVQVLVFGEGNGESFEDQEPIMKRTPRIETAFIGGGNPSEVMSLDHAGRKFRSEYSGTFIAAVACRFGEGARLLALAGRVRHALSYLSPVLKPPILPAWLVITYLSESSSTPTVENREDDEIELAISFNITFRIRSDAFVSDHGPLWYNGISVVYNGIPLTFNYAPQGE